MHRSIRNQIADFFARSERSTQLTSFCDSFPPFGMNGLDLGIRHARRRLRRCDATYRQTKHRRHGRQ
jgi:hypothetical protein